MFINEMIDVERHDISQVYPHGSTDTLPFATMGSGSLAAMSVFESRYKENLTVSVFSTSTTISSLNSLCIVPRTSLFDYVLRFSLQFCRERSQLNYSMSSSK
jgi:hypothetical protein